MFIVCCFRKKWSVHFAPLISNFYARLILTSLCPCCNRSRKDLGYFGIFWSLPKAKHFWRWLWSFPCQVPIAENVYRFTTISPGRKRRQMTLTNARRVIAIGSLHGASSIRSCGGLPAPVAIASIAKGIPPVRSSVRPSICVSVSICLYV